SDNNQGRKSMEKIEKKLDKLKKEEEKVEVGEIRPGINLQGYCTNEYCLAAKAKLPIWVNIEFGDISFVSNNTSYCCPDCRQLTVTSITKAMLFNSEHSICASGESVPVKDNCYQCFYTIKSGLVYKLKAKKIRQHATSLEDLISRSEHAMNSEEILNLVAELQKYLITVVKPPKVKDNVRLLEKIRHDYSGDFNQVFDIGRFTILCDNPTKLQTAVAVMKKAEQFNLIVSEDKDFFERQSRTHHRFHNIKLYVPKHDVYIEMQATLKIFTTLEGYTVIENPKLSHLFYELIRAWKPSDSEEKELKQASDETLTKINDIICEWIDDKGTQILAKQYRSHLDIGILKPPQLSKKTEAEINEKIPLKIAQFEKLFMSFYTNITKKKLLETKIQQVVLILHYYYTNQKSKRWKRMSPYNKRLKHISPKSNNYPHIDGDDSQKHETHDCHQRVIDFLEKEEKKSEQEHQRKVMIIQGKSGSGKSLFCRHLEETLWNDYKCDSKRPIPVYISLSKAYNKQNETNIILQALQGKHVSNEIIDAIREKVSFVFIMDGFDEIFDFYRNSDKSGQYFYDRFNLNQWNAKVIVTCRINVLNEADIQTTLTGINQNYVATSMMYLWPFTKQQMRNSDNWTLKQYEETLSNYPNLQKMMEEPFLLQLILTVLPSLVKKYGETNAISKSHVYEVFNDYWIDIHMQHVISKLAELRIQISINKIKSKFKQYCLDLGFDMFVQGSQVAIETESRSEDSHIWTKLDPVIENKNNDSIVDEKKEIKSTDKTTDASVVKIQDVWEKYFNGDSIAKYLLRRTGDNKYQFLHKSCQEYYAAHKIIFDILSWRSETFSPSDQEFQKQFESYASNFIINSKLLNEEAGIIEFISERIFDTNPIFVNLKSRLFRIIEASKTNEHTNIAAANAITILNSANVNLHYRDWSNIKIPHAILDHAFLEGTDFKNANLDNVSFFQAFLNKANFTNASMNEIYFGEYAYLNGHLGDVNGIGVSPDCSKIVSCSNDKTIRIWDLSSGRQLQALEGHKEGIHAAQFSPDGSKIVSGSSDQTIQIWNLSSNQPVQLLEGHSDNVNEVQFSPDGSKVISCSTDRTIRIWDLLSGQHIQVLEGHSSSVTGVQLSPDSSKLVSCSWDKTIRVWDFLSGKQLQLLEGHTGTVTKASFSPDCSKVVSCSWDKTIRLWDVFSGKQIQVLEGHSEWINSVQFSSDSSKIVSGSDDSTIRIWDVSSGNQLQLLEGHAGAVTGVKFFFNDSKIVSCSRDKTIRIWDASLNQKIQVVKGHSSKVNKVQFSPDSTKIVSCSDDKTIRLWDVSSGRQIQLLEGHFNRVHEVQFSSDGSRIVSYSSDQTIRIWDALSGRQLRLFDSTWGLQVSPDLSKIVPYSDNKTLQIFDISSGRQIQSLDGLFGNLNEVQFSPDYSKIAARFDNKIVRVWDVLSGKQLQSFEEDTHFIHRMRFSPDSSKIVICTRETVHMWDVLSGEHLQYLKGHSAVINEIEFLPDWSKLATCSNDKTIRLWDASSGKQLLLLEGHSKRISGIQFSPDGSKILSCSWDRTIGLWDVLSGKQLHVLKGHSSDIRKAQFSPDGSKVVSYSRDKTIRIWDVSSGQQVQLLEGHTGDINGIQFSPDGSKIVSCSQDRTIRLWGIDNKTTDVGLMKCIWQAGVHCYGLSMKDSIWENINCLTPQQKLLVEQRGGTF
ncbi:NB-ARC domain-containing protein, partial [Reticulomyxa filosa]